MHANCFFSLNEQDEKRHMKTHLLFASQVLLVTALEKKKGGTKNIHIFTANNRDLPPLSSESSSCYATASLRKQNVFDFLFSSSKSRDQQFIIVDIDYDGNKKKKVNWHAGLFVFLLTVEFGRGV